MIFSGSFEFLHMRKEKSMNVYFDTEFTGLGHADPKLISIGMVSDAGEKFYAEFTDFGDDYKNEEDTGEWIEENVLKNLKADVMSGPAGGVDGEAFYDEQLRTLFVAGNSKYVADVLEDWFIEMAYGKDSDDEAQYSRIQLVSDVCHYDMYLLCNLFGGAFNLPKNVNAACFDICQMIGTSAALGADGELCDEMRWAFDENREKLLEACGVDLGMNDKHNSLYDAEVIKALYEKILETERVHKMYPVTEYVSEMKGE